MKLFKAFGEILYDYNKILLAYDKWLNYKNSSRSNSSLKYIHVNVSYMYRMYYWLWLTAT